MPEIGWTGKMRDRQETEENKGGRKTGRRQEIQAGERDLQEAGKTGRR